MIKKITQLDIKYGKRGQLVVSIAIILLNYL